MRRRRVLAALAAASAFCCADLGQYVWADSLPDPPATPDAEYRLAPGDLIFVKVFNQDSLSGRTRVRPDGRVTIPFVNDVPAAGRTTTELANSMEVLLRDFIKSPVVTVFLEEMGPAQLSVLGEVAKPGVYPLDRNHGSVLHALASAGGFTEFAHKDRIFVVRTGTPTPRRIRFTLEGLSTPGSRSARFRLQNDDVVVVQ